MALMMRSWPMEVIPAEPFRLKLTGDTCQRCHREMVDREQWQTLTREVRLELKANFASGPPARGLCRGCYHSLRVSDPDSLLDYGRRSRSYREFAEEYVAMKEQGMTDYHIADRLGMLRKNYRYKSEQLANLDKAIRRCKEKGYL